MKRALSVGINYIGTGTDLKGCINDAYNMKAMLEKKGFEVKLLLEKEATTDGIKSALEWLVADTEPGDVIVFHYSGHGSQLPSRVEADGWEEIICPYDLNWRDKVITDNTLRQIFNKVPNGVNITLFLDCWHAGDTPGQTESAVTLTKEIAVGEGVAGSLQPRKKKGDRYLKPPASVLKKLEDREMVEWSASRDVNATAMLIAACRPDQTSADAVIDGIPQGAGTASLLRSVKENPNITYKQLVEEMNTYMIAKKFTQRPVLDGSFGLYNETFLSPWSMSVATSVDSALIQDEASAKVKATKEHHCNEIIVTVALVLLISFIIFL